MQRLLVTALTLALAACSGDQAEHTNDSHGSTASETTADPLPPGFMDEPPPPPESNTIVLSGGVLVTGEVTQDAAIVLADGRLLAWGKRGEVDMPNDSVGRDMRGKWIAPGTLADLDAGAVPNLALLEASAPAHLLIFNTGPDLSSVTAADLHGLVEAGELHLLVGDTR